MTNKRKQYADVRAVCFAVAALFTILPPKENKVVAAVANEYKLTEEQTALMCAIRRAENGIPPYYFGVADRRCVGYDAQCRWCANTIRKRYTGELEAFGRRWCPTNWRVWLKNVRWFMRKQGFEK